MNALLSKLNSIHAGGIHDNEAQLPIIANSIAAAYTTNQLLDYDSIKNGVFWKLGSKIWINFEDVLRVVLKKHHSIRIDIQQDTNAKGLGSNHKWSSRLEFADVVSVERDRPVDRELVAGTFVEDAQSNLQVSSKVKVVTKSDSFDVLMLEKFDIKINANEFSREIPKIEINMWRFTSNTACGSSS